MFYFVKCYVSKILYLKFYIKFLWLKNFLLCLLQYAKLKYFGTWSQNHIYGKIWVYYENILYVIYIIVEWTVHL